MDLFLSLSLVPSKKKRDEDYSSSHDDESFHCCKRPKLPVDVFDADHPAGIDPRTKDLISKLRLGDPGPSVTAVLAMDLSLSLSLVPSKGKRDEDSSSSSSSSDDDDDEDDDDDDDTDDDDDDPFQYCCKRPKHDVFLSYSNEDIGKGFVSHLKGALQRHGFDISDHTTLPIGQDESSELLRAIEESWIYVVVFSEKYPFSVECLDELVLIMDSISKFNNNRRRVVPIFYKVDPSHVRSQNRSSFLQVFQAHHQKHVDGERVEKWKHSLKDAGNLAGQEFQIWENEEEFIRKIVIMLGKLKLPIELFNADHPVGIEPRAQDLISELRLGDPDPSITAVLGMSGSGKTTLVKAVYDKIVPDFDTNCFIENIRYYKHNGPNWEREVISRFNGVDYGIHHVSASSNIKKIASNRKFLLVLDDVDKYEQLQALGVHDPASFAPGSRILVTTTNKQPLSGLKKYTSYDMKLLNHQESSELFIGLAYEEGQSADHKFVRDIVCLAGGVPLVLEVWGRYFKSHDIKLWPRLLEKLRRIPHEDVQRKLQVSYDALSPRAKELFLDIACFFEGVVSKDHVIKALEDEDNAFFPDIEIQDLIDRYLVKETNDYFTLHDVIMKMGQEVVRQENEDDPGQRSRLEGMDAYRVLRDCSGTNSVRSICIYMDDLDDDCVTVQLDQAFRNMSNVRFIKFSDELIVGTILSDLSPLCLKHLKYLGWFGFPFKSLDMFKMENVVVIKLNYSKLEILWEGFKSLKKLRILHVYLSYKLKRTGSFIELENLEELDLSNCKNLEELDGSIGCLQKLVTLNLSGCESLKELDGSIGCLQKLVTLNLSGCESLKELDGSIGCLQKLVTLNLSGCESLKELDGSIGCLQKLVTLNLRGCVSLKELDDSIGCLQKLVTLNLSGCVSLKALNGSIGCLQKLVTLYLSRCYRLERIPWELIHKLTSLTTLELYFCPKILNILHELWNLPDILRIRYMLNNPDELWNPPNVFNITREGYNTFLAIPKEKHDNMGKGQGEVIAFPEFDFIYCSLKSHQMFIGVRDAYHVS